MRQRLYAVMWDDVGILRDAEGLKRARDALDALATDVATAAVPDKEPRYNLTWMDRLNLENMVLVSRVIRAAAEARHDSRGAHFREVFPEPSAPATSRFPGARLDRARIAADPEPVTFTRVRPGETLLPEAAE